VGRGETQARLAPISLDAFVGPLNPWAAVEPGRRRPVDIDDSTAGRLFGRGAALTELHGDSVSAGPLRALPLRLPNSTGSLDRRDDNTRVRRSDEDCSEGSLLWRLSIM